MVQEPFYILKKKSIGIDIAHNQIKYAKKYAKKNIKFLTYKNRLIKSIHDSVSMIELIEHIDNRDLTYY